MDATDPSTQQPTRAGDIDVYPVPRPLTKSFSKDQITSRRVFEDETDHWRSYR